MTIPRAPIQSICLALPAYNEAGQIGELLRQAADVLSRLRLHWSIVVVDDGSRDETAAIVRDLATRIPELTLVQHPQNRGLGPAIITGLKAAMTRVPDAAQLAGHMIVGMDADLTHPPQTIPMMLNAMNEGADLVIASRFQSGSEQRGVPAKRRLMSLGARLLFRYYLNLPNVRDYTCGFRAMRGSLLAGGFRHFGEGLITRAGFACTDELLVHLALLKPVIREVPFSLRYDLKRGASKMDLGVTIRETLKLLRAHRRSLKEK
jgi:dolichol-phosphate mannosyltransferase